MSDRPNRHRRGASQTVFALPETLISSFEAPPLMEVGEKKTAAKQGQASPEGADPSPSPSTAAGQEVKEGVPEKHRED
ncbi:hypothetical protein Cni_G25363 [Canna indica]|uniref:Uncharacterized protein n=1 Tax=Canna indica TaxID=4628 RepID=A0AAQ3QPD4_9LILI|nr:hypothetical protein Cni_G25363 [Canna indica]